MPPWVTPVAVVSLIAAGVSAAIIASDLLAGHRQRMWIMNLVWPLTALYAGPLALWAYWVVGRRAVSTGDTTRREDGRAGHGGRPFWQSVALAATHCGGGCTLGDLLVEGVLLSLVPFTLFGQRILAAWVVDFVFAFLLGIAFQYFTIAPMKQLSPRQGLAAALKADSLSLTAWQVGMYGWMGIVTFLIVGHELDKGGPVFWFMMQLAMMAGFLTSYPVNWWLVGTGLKETM